MRLLVVDDEVEILAGLRRLLYAYDDRWEVEFADGAASAWMLLERGRFDVIVSEIRMKGTDGIALLERVEACHPQTIRFVLSGNVDDTTAIRSLKVAHQFLLKPFEPQLFCSLVQQTSQLLSLMHDGRMHDHFESFSRLPAAPHMYNELSSALQREETTTSHVVALLKQDPTMTAKVLQLANSGFFARRVSTADLHTALLHLGMNLIRNLVLTVELFDVGGIVGRHVLAERELLRQKALRLALLSEQLAAGTPLRSDAFAMGLLADIGKLVLWLNKGDAWLKCRSQAAKSAIPLHELEAAEFGITHAEAGGFLLGIWGLPFSVVDAVVRHHHLEREDATHAGAAAIVAIAAAMVERTHLDREWLTRIGMLARVDELRQVCPPGGG